MQQITEFRGPGADEYANVLVLNTAFIEATTTLKGPQRGRLAASPFLLFSLRETDIEWWELALTDRAQADFMTPVEHCDAEIRSIQTAAVSFLWQLSRRNSYAARIISGASNAWCDLITDLPLLTLLNRLGARADLIISRIENAAGSGDRLLDHGTSSARKVRHASQLTVLQALLTQTVPADRSMISTAACSMAGPLQVSDKKV